MCGLRNISSSLLSLNSSNWSPGSCLNMSCKPFCWSLVHHSFWENKCLGLKFSYHNEELNFNIALFTAAVDGFRTEIPFRFLKTSNVDRVCKMIGLRHGCDSDVCSLFDDEEAKKTRTRRLQHRTRGSFLSLITLVPCLRLSPSLQDGIVLKRSGRYSFDGGRGSRARTTAAGGVWPRISRRSATRSEPAATRERCEEIRLPSSPKPLKNCLTLQIQPCHNFIRTAISATLQGAMARARPFRPRGLLLFLPPISICMATRLPSFRLTWLLLFWLSLLLLLFLRLLSLLAMTLWINGA